MLQKNRKRKREQNLKYEARIYNLLHNMKNIPKFDYLELKKNIPTWLLIYLVVLLINANLI